MSERLPSKAPWIATGDVPAFKEFCITAGHQVRDHTDPWRTGFQVQHAGHWMAVVYNKAYKRYTADRRLSLLVQSFAAR